MDVNNLVWMVETAFSGGNIHYNLFLTEDEAKAYCDSKPENWYRKMYRTRDIWNFREKEIARRMVKEDGDDRTNLKRIREANGFSQSKLAETSGVSVRMIQHYEQGVKDINAAGALTVYKLAQALNCTVEDLIEIEKNRE